MLDSDGFKNFPGSNAKLWEIDKLQLFELKDKDTSLRILIGHGCADWSYVHFYWNHNRKANQNKRK
jgi:hypothetical protein